MTDTDVKKYRELTVPNRETYTVDKVHSDSITLKHTINGGYATLGLRYVLLLILEGKLTVN